MQEKKITIAVPQVLAGQDGQTAILEAAGLNGVCTDQHLTVLRVFGNTTPYLKNENFTFALCELLPDDVSVMVKAAAHQALKTHQRVTLSGLNFGSSGTRDQHVVDIVISPFFSAGTTDRQVLFLFAKNKRKATDKSLITPGAMSHLTREYLASLEHELAVVKNDLESAHQVINSSNENIQSFNEELQSANEEMHSANEELQSVNEELQSVNSQQQQTNTELTESNDDLNNYFRSNTNGQLFVDHDMLLKRYSPGALKHINLRESDIGRPLTHITTNIKFETLVEDITRVMLDGQPITREAESNDGKIYQVMTMPYIRQNTNNPDGAIITFYDITELKKLLSALDSSNKNLTASVATIELSRAQVSQSLEKEKQLNIMKSRFVSMASHEFKTPLTAIQLSAELIGKVALKMEHPAVKKYTGTILNAAKNLTNILNDFLSLELLETGRINPVLKEFDVVEFAENITEDMRPLGKKGQQISYRHVGTTRLVTLNSSLLKNCIINLISNAIKYSGPESLIELSTETTVSHLVIIISDNGIGIPKEDQKHLFEAFFRAHNTGIIPGTGLGLNIVMRYTALMHGKIRFKSNINEGTTFTITFPIRPKNLI